MPPVQTGNDNPTLFDLAQANGVDGMALRIVEQLSLRRPFMQDMVWREGNLTTGHRIARRSALPSVTYKKLNKGIPNSKSLQDQVDEQCGMMALKNTLDEDIVALNGGAAYRMQQDMAMHEALANELETGMFYNSSKLSPEKWLGLSPRLDALSGIPFAKQAVDCGLSPSGNDQASMWFITWADDKVYGIYPKGTAAGLQYQDRGIVMVPDENGDTYPAYVAVWKWRVGLCVEDARYVVRLCNIDTSALAVTGKILIEGMIKAAHQMFDRDRGRSAIYCNRLIGTYLHQQALDTSKQSTFKMEDPGGPNQVVKFLGMPIRETDALLNTESPLV